MEPAQTNLTFHLHLKSGGDKFVEADSMEDLIEREFRDEKEFHRLVETLVWKRKSTLFIYHTDRKEIEKRIADGDVNPYGWRLQHR